MNKKTALIGYTGFVGSNLKEQFEFDELYNSSNIEQIRNKKFSLVVCAGIRAQKWYANQNQEKDMNEISQLFDILSSIKTDYFVLISTIDVYPNPVNVNEDTVIDSSINHAYGKNRLEAEELAKKMFSHLSILRLPALFGKGLKKNFIFDMLHPIPSNLNLNLFKQLEIEMSKKDFSIIESNYTFVNNAYSLKLSEKNELLNTLKKYNRTSLMFTDENDQFQFYPLKRLWSDVEKCINNKLALVNLVTEPISASELFYNLYQQDYKNSVNRKSVQYDIQSKYCEYFNQNRKYLISKKEIIEQIKKFIEDYQE